MAIAYADLTAGAPSRNGDDREYGGNRGAIARTWAVGLVADDAGLTAALAVGGALALTLAAELFAAVDAGPAGHPALLAGWVRGLASLVALVGILVAGLLVGLLRQAYADPPKRKSIGALWDVGTFWPRDPLPPGLPKAQPRPHPAFAGRSRPAMATIRRTTRMAWTPPTEPVATW